MRGFRYVEGVATLELDESRCTGCGMCAIVCPHRVFEIRDGHAAITDEDACMECGACVTNCTERAISVDAGVGCASAIIRGWLTGAEPTCGCSDEGSGAC